MPRSAKNLVVAAIQRRRAFPYPPLQVANGTRADTMPGPQVLDTAVADATKAAWEPLVTGQIVPMQGEPVYDPTIFDE